MCFYKRENTRSDSEEETTARPVRLRRQNMSRQQRACEGCRAEVQSTPLPSQILYWLQILIINQQQHNSCLPYLLMWNRNGASPLAAGRRMRRWVDAPQRWERATGGKTKQEFISEEMYSYYICMNVYRLLTVYYCTCHRIYEVQTSC